MGDGVVEVAACTRGRRSRGRCRRGRGRRRSPRFRRWACRSRCRCLGSGASADRTPGRFEQSASGPAVLGARPIRRNRVRWPWVSVSRTQVRAPRSRAWPATTRATAAVTGTGTPLPRTSPVLWVAASSLVRVSRVITTPTSRCTRPLPARQHRQACAVVADGVEEQVELGHAAGASAQLVAAQPADAGPAGGGDGLDQVGGSGDGHRGQGRVLRVRPHRDPGASADLVPDVLLVVAAERRRRRS